ncbi:MAG: hypothetical protein SPI53_04885 [Erysipelotrichaceae bacterium]|nr:hypothetical protein [Erysipelotrichaceae bacterium]
MNGSIFFTIFIILTIIIIYFIVLIFKSIDTKTLTSINNTNNKIKNNLTLINIKKEAINHNFNCGLIKGIKIALPLYLIFNKNKGKPLHHTLIKNSYGIFKLFK